MSDDSLLQAPILLVNWLAREIGEIDTALQSFGQEVLIKSAKSNSKEDVISVIGEWLSGNTNAQFLYIGCHGDSLGLFKDDRQPLRDRLDWEELGEVLRQHAHTVSLWLGACDSAAVARAWSGRDDQIPVRYIVGFLGKIKAEEVSAVLQQLIKMTGHDPITYLDEELEAVRTLLPESKMVTYFKIDKRYLLTDYFEQESGESFRKYLERQPNGLG